MADGQQNVNLTPGDDNDGPRGSWVEHRGGYGGGPPWNNRPPWWEGVVTTLVWTVCTIIVIGFIIWGILFIFHDVVGTLPMPH